MEVSPTCGGTYFQSSHIKVAVPSWELFTFKLGIAKQHEKLKIEEQPSDFEMLQWQLELLKFIIDKISQVKLSRKKLFSNSAFYSLQALSIPTLIELVHADLPDLDSVQLEF